MCDLSGVRLFWHELLPYVDVTPNKTRVLINRTGVLYNFFRESLAECCGSDRFLDYEFDNDRLQHQQAVLNNVYQSAAAVGMPVSLDAEFPYTPTEFVPVLQTDGLFWVKVKEPTDSGAALGGIGANGVTLLFVLITMTGYAAVVLWLLEAASKKTHDSFIRGLFDSYWCAFISITTIGYGDKVPQSIAAKLFTMFWILFGICLVSTFTAIITTVMSTLSHDMTTNQRPFYDEFIGVLDGSFDYLVLVKKSANSIRYPDMKSLIEALNNGSTFNIVMDKHAYWIYRAWIQQNQSFEFQTGVQNPTSIGYIYNTRNSSLLRCLKMHSDHNQGQISLRLQVLVKEAIEMHPPEQETDEVKLLFGPYTYIVIQLAACTFGILCACGLLVEYLLIRQRMRRRQTVVAVSSNNAEFTDSL